MIRKSHILGGGGIIALACIGFVAPGMAQQQPPANSNQAAPATQPRLHSPRQTTRVTVARHPRRELPALTAELPGGHAPPSAGAMQKPVWVLAVPV